MSNAEDRVIGDIEALIDEQLEAGEQWGEWQPCRCGDDWHGLRNHLGCPGSEVAGPIHVRPEPLPFQLRDRSGYTIGDLEALREQWQGWQPQTYRAEELGPYSYQEWFGSEVPEPAPELQFPRPMGGEPAWLIGMLDQLMGYVLETLGTIMGLDVSEIGAMLEVDSNSHPCISTHTPRAIESGIEGDRAPMPRRALEASRSHAERSPAFPGTTTPV